MPIEKLSDQYPESELDEDDKDANQEQVPGVTTMHLNRKKKAIVAGDKIRLLVDRDASDGSIVPAGSEVDITEPSAGEPGVFWLDVGATDFWIHSDEEGTVWEKISRKQTTHLNRHKRAMLEEGNEVILINSTELYVDDVVDPVMFDAGSHFVVEMVVGDVFKAFNAATGETAELYGSDEGTVWNKVSAKRPFRGSRSDRRRLAMSKEAAGEGDWRNGDTVKFVKDFEGFTIDGTPISVPMGTEGISVLDEVHLLPDRDPRVKIPSTQDGWDHLEKIKDYESGVDASKQAQLTVEDLEDDVQHQLENGLLIFKDYSTGNIPPDVEEGWMVRWTPFEGEEETVDGLSAEQAIEYSNSKISSKTAMAYSMDEAMVLGDALGVDWDAIDHEQFLVGLNVEAEHGESVDYDENMIAQIVLDHLDEDLEYYMKLKEVEGQYKRSQKFEVGDTGHLRDGIDVWDSEGQSVFLAAGTNIIISDITEYKYEFDDESGYSYSVLFVGSGAFEHDFVKDSRRKQSQTKGAPASWVEDEDIWEKAKAEVNKDDYDEDSYYAVVTDVYKSMGGKVSKRSKTAQRRPERQIWGNKQAMQVRIINDVTLDDPAQEHPEPVELAAGTLLDIVEEFAGDVVVTLPDGTQSTFDSQDEGTLWEMITSEGDEFKVV